MTYCDIVVLYDRGHGPHGTIRHGDETMLSDLSFKRNLNEAQRGIDVLGFTPLLYSGLRIQGVNSYTPSHLICRIKKQTIKSTKECDNQ